MTQNFDLHPDNEGPEIVQVYNLEEDEMIDEIIETDPDEAQHHPIVDGDGDEYEEESYQEETEVKKFKEDNEESSKFDGYDSSFFKK